MTMSRDKKFGIAMLVTAILSVTNAIVAFAIGAWTAPALPVISLSQIFTGNQVALGLAFLYEGIIWVSP